MIGNRKIVDCFPFYNELPILNLRFHELNGVVDHFVLSEATKTHAGNIKSLFYEENKYCFPEFDDKVTHVVVDDMPYIAPQRRLPSFSKKRHPWRLERHQRRALCKGIDQLSLKDDDIIILSDLDEIPNPETLEDFVLNGTLDGRALTTEEKYAIQMRMFFYNFETEKTKLWYAARLFTYKYYKDNGRRLNSFRKDSNLLASKSWRRERSCMLNGGWHCTWFGSAEDVQEKATNWAHCGEVNNQMKNLDRLKDKMEEGKFFMNSDASFNATRKNNVDEDTNLPKYKHLAFYPPGRGIRANGRRKRKPKKI
jgi:beta-1,4-mannosyl-glycoprotein beta-1,4-N-acetylglucosaminyltransferase